MAPIADRRPTEIMIQFRGVAIATPQLQNVLGRSWGMGIRGTRGTGIPNGTRTRLFRDGSAIESRRYRLCRGRKTAPRAPHAAFCAFDTDQVALRASRREDGIMSQSTRMLRFPAV